MRRDRDGSELVEDEPLTAAQVSHALLCVEGWIGQDGEGRPRPCPICRDHLKLDRRRLRYALLGRTA